MSDIITMQSEEVTRYISTLDRLQTAIEKLATSNKPTLVGERYITDEELSERLKVSERTLQDWRSKGIIEYIKFPGKIVYAESAVERLLESCFRKAWSEPKR